MPRPRSYRVSLTQSERNLLKITQKKTHSEVIRKRCAVLLAADEGHWKQVKSLGDISNASGASKGTVINTIKIFCKSGISEVLTIHRNPASDTARLKATGDIEAKIIAHACKRPPKGFVRWTVTLLTEAMAVVLEEPLGRSTIHRTMQRNKLRPHLNSYWCIPPEEDAAFVACMEDILDVYQRPYDPKYPVWCMDEKPYQLLGNRREPIPMRPGDTAKIDSEYERHGTASIFCFIQPHIGTIRHFVEPTRTAVDWAEKIKCLVDEIDPDAEKIVLVMDNLNTHNISSLYKTFPPEEARRIAKKLEIHYTPKHGSWLNIAEIGINIMTRECLNQRIDGIDALRKELRAWNDAYDKDPTEINWQFQTEDARIKLRRLYPDIDNYRKDRDQKQEMKRSNND